MPAARIEIRAGGVNELLLAPDSPVMKELVRKARRVQRNARRMAPGKMGRRVKAVVVGRHVRVESNHPATMYVIKGTRPHQIRPRTRQVLKFTTKRGTVFARVVNHPGNKPNDFMTKALRMG
ncbi:hypothetical protein [Streptomyces africanus]|uniref:hypothetical protein n=1 Tax=Streptomyces africanus TaxID=231024 RepID=UPI000A3CAA2E|nr:hypothetical protein [Streptomyces africanus]